MKTIILSFILLVGITASFAEENQIEREILKEYEKVEALGGAIAAIEKGYYIAAITDWHYTTDQSKNL
jgi:methylmalonyl-CoA mutase N-terminal domain/subunit